MNSNNPPPPLAESIDYDGIMQANLTRVFGEVDPAKRLKAIRELYTEDAVLNDPDASVKGHAAINDVVTALLAHLPPAFTFRALGPAIGHHGVGRLKWKSGEPGGPPAATGIDVAHFAGNRINTLFVFLDPPTET